MARREQFNVNQLTVGSINGHPFPGGIGMGKAHYVAATSSSTSKYRDWLVSNGVNPSDIYSTVNLAYAATVDYRNDVIFVTPEVHTLTADLTWAKNHTHLVGLGGPAVESDYSVGGCTITSVGTASVFNINITGHRNQFHNVCLDQHAAAAGALTACQVSSYGNYFENVHFIGQMTDEADTVTTSSSLQMHTYSGFSIFKNCVIGSPLWAVRGTAKNAVIRFTNTSGATLPQDILFQGCRIFSNSATATQPAVALEANNAVDRLLEFRDCTFYNFQSNLGSVLTSGVFRDACGTTHMILLSGSTCQYGWSDWADVHTYIYAVGPTASATGGTAVVTA